MKKRIHQIELFMKYPNEVQEEWFFDLISTAQATEWGKKYDYESITSPEEFKNRVPLQDYDSLKPYIERMVNGEENILWPSTIKWFAKSSGTTSDRSKFIPVSDEALEDCHYKGGKDLVSIFCNNRPDTNVFKGKGLVLGGSHQMNEMGNTIHGDLSAIIVKNLPFWAEYIRVPDRVTTLNPNFEEKIEKVAQLAMNENITSISGVPTWNVVLAKRILEITGKANLLEVWPNLEFYFHGGVSFKPYREQFKALIPSDYMYYMENYNASEGYFAIQDQSDSEEMLLMLDYGIYFEFLPIENLDKEFSRIKGYLNKNNYPVHKDANSLYFIYNSHNLMLKKTYGEILNTIDKATGYLDVMESNGYTNFYNLEKNEYQGGIGQKDNVQPVQAKEKEKV